MKYSRIPALAISFLSSAALAQNYPSPTFQGLTVKSPITSIIGSSPNYGAPVSASLSTAPSSYGNWASPITAFSGDLSHVWDAQQIIVSGTATLTQPSSGYVLHPETFGSVMNVYNTSGWNQSTSGNNGRTATGGLYIQPTQYGQGDLIALWCSGNVESTKPGATSYLASPAVECLAGSLTGVANGAFIEWLGDMDISDAGAYDISAVGESFVFNRTIATEGIGANWYVRNVQPIGAAPIDAIDRASGPIVTGYDLTNVTMGYWRLASYSFISGGSGYTVGDVLTVSGGTLLTNGPVTKFVVTAAPAGAITTVSIVNTGIYTTPPVTTYSALTLTGGSGTGASLSGQYTDNNVMLLPSAGGCIAPGVSTGSTTTEMSGIYSRFCITQDGMSFGGANNSLPASPGANNVQFGDNITFQGIGNLAVGNNIYDEAQHNAAYFSSGPFPTGGIGRSQNSTRIFRAVGTGSTLRLTADAAAAANNNTYFAPVSSAHNIDWRCNAIDVTTPANTATWSKWRDAALTRGATGDVGIDPTPSPIAVDHYTGTGSTATITIGTDTTYEGLNVTFTAPSGGDNWRAQCRLDIDQIIGN